MEESQLEGKKARCTNERKRKNSSWERGGKKATQKYNPALLAASIGSYSTMKTWWIEKYLQLVQPVEQVTVKHLSQCQMRHLCTQSVV